MFSHWVLLFSTVAIRTAEEIEVLGLEDIDIDSIDVNSAEFSVLGDTSHIDHKDLIWKANDKEIDEGSRESRGWGDHHEWVTLLDAMIDGSEYKPIMLILFDRNCDKDIHCSELRREFKENSEIDLLSPHFHMVNLMGLAEHNQHFDDMITNPWYLPRIFFLEDNGDIIKWASNKLRKDDKEYYYNHASGLNFCFEHTTTQNSEIVKTMHDVIGAYHRAHDEL